MKASTWLLLLLFGSSFLLGIRVQGHVYDEDGIGIEGAYIVLGDATTRSLKDGFYRIDAMGDSLKVSRLGFKSKSVRAIPGSLDIVLTSQPIELPTILVSQSYEPYIQATDMLSVSIDPDRHYYSTMDILGEASGTISQDSPLKGESQSLGLLGNLPRHTLVVLDGVPLNTDGQSFDFSLLDPQNIQSIQIIKNNASVYGGAAAIGGVVLITSKQPSKEADEYKTSLELGSFGYADLRVSLRGGWEKTFYRIAMGVFHADNDFSYKPRPWWNEDESGIRSNNSKQQNSLSLGWGISSEKAYITLQSELDDYYRQLPGTINFIELYRNAFLEGFSSRNRLNIQSNLGGLQIRGQAWFNRDKSLYDNTSAPLPVFRSKYEQLQDKAGLQLGLDKSQGLVRLNGTTNISFSRYLNDNLLKPNEKINIRDNQASLSIKAGVEQEAGDWAWSTYLAGRKDITANDKFHSARAELELKHFGIWQTSLGSTWGSSFALPSSFDLHWKGDSQAIGNPELKSEKSQGGQIWIDATGMDVYLRCALHINRVKDLIQWRQVQMYGNAWKPLNIGKVQLYNLELEGSWDAKSWLNFKADALYTDARDLSAHPFYKAPQLMYTPKMVYGIKTSMSYGKQKLWGRYSYRGKQYITVDNLADPIDGYELFDLGYQMSFKIKDAKMNLHLKLQNVFNKRYEVYPYVPQPGRAVYLGAQVIL